MIATTRHSAFSSNIRIAICILGIQSAIILIVVTRAILVTIFFQPTARKWTVHFFVEVNLLSWETVCSVAVGTDGVELRSTILGVRKSVLG